MKELDIIITISDNEIYVTKTESEDGEFKGYGFLNKKFDIVTLHIQKLEDAENKSC